MEALEQVRCGGAQRPGQLKAARMLFSRSQFMADKKVVFVAFAIEDETQRNFLKGQSLLTKCPFEYVDMSVKNAYDKDWKERVQTRIRRSDGVIALVSKNSLKSTGQLWEIGCAKAEKKKLRGIRAYTDDKTELDGVYTVAWTWDNIKNFIDGL
jgi:hypothetical protein